MPSSPRKKSAPSNIIMPQATSLMGHGRAISIGAVALIVVIAGAFGYMAIKNKMDAKQAALHAEYRNEQLQAIAEMRTAPTEPRTFTAETKKARDEFFSNPAPQVTPEQVATQQAEFYKQSESGYEVWKAQKKSSQ